MQDYIFNQAAAIIIIVLNSISFVALAVVLLIYLWNWKRIKSFAMRLVILSQNRTFYLCIACLIQSLQVLMLNPILVNRYEQTSNTSGFCIFQSVLKVAFDLSSMVWNTLIMFSIYASIVKSRQLTSLEIPYLILAFLIPIVASIIPAFFNIYGYNVYFCWFNTENVNTQFIFKMCYYYGPLWVFYIFSMFFAIVSYNKMVKLEFTPRQLSIFRRLLMFPFILLIAGLFSTIYEIYTYATGSKLEWLSILSIIFHNLYGILNALAYSFNPLIKEKIMSIPPLNLLSSKEKSQASSIEMARDRNFSDSSNTSTSNRTERLQELISPQ